MKPIRLFILFLLGSTCLLHAGDRAAPNVAAIDSEGMIFLDNGTVRIGIDRAKGASLSWLSWSGYPKNMINAADPGRLIQPSYYAGRSLDRRADGQSNSWSPWTWNPIQGGGAGSWARVKQFKRIDKNTLFGETIPKLWDMPDEEAAALMRQWTGFEPGMSNVVVVRCEFVSRRDPNDRRGPAVWRPQEVPACYFTRNFAAYKSYSGRLILFEDSADSKSVRPPRRRESRGCRHR